MTKYIGPERRFKKGTLRDRATYDWTKIQPMRAEDFKRPIIRKKQEEKRPRVTSSLTPEEIRSVRMRSEMTQFEFGQETGVSKTTVYQWERGERKPSRASEKLILEIAKNPKMVDF